VSVAHPELIEEWLLASSSDEEPAEPRDASQGLRDCMESVGSKRLRDLRAFEGVGLLLSSWSIRRLFEDPSRALELEDEPFSWTPDRARRQVGRQAFQVALAGGMPPAAATAVVVDQMAREAGGERDGWSGSLPAWLAGLPPGARGVVQAEACSWATELWDLVDWPHLQSGLASRGWRVAAQHGKDRWRFRGSPRVTMESQTDIRVVAAPGSAGAGSAAARQLGAIVLVERSYREATAADDLAFAALVSALSRGKVPRKVLGYWPQAGVTLMVDVNRQLLLDAVARLDRLLERLSYLSCRE